jgi:hypothetical protein
MLKENNYIVNPPKFITNCKNKHTLDLLPWRNATVDPSRVIIKIVNLDKGIVKIDYSNNLGYRYTTGNISCVEYTYNSNYVNQLIILRQLCNNGTFAEFMYKKDIDTYQMILPIIDGMDYRIMLKCELYPTNEHKDSYVI